MGVREKVEYLPHLPGVYRFFNEEGVVIYVGKAKDLKRRVSQYFRPEHALDRKTSVMVKKIADLQHIVVETEEDALLLENNLIKELQPRYNILLKDSKTYPWLCIKNEQFPRVFKTRKYVKDGSQYFGPYSSAVHANNLIELIHSIYKVRICTLSLSQENISAAKFRPCLNYHLGKCGAPCIGLVSESDYKEMVKSITTLLKGGVASLIKEFSDKMKEAAGKLDFEKAQEMKEKKELLENHYSKSLIVGQGERNIDVFSLVADDFDVFCNFMRIREGCIIQSFNMELKMRIEQDHGEVLGIFMGEMISKFGPLAKEIIVPFMPDYEFAEHNIHIPQKGDKLSLLELSRKNAHAMKFNKLKQEEKSRPEEHKERIMSNLQKDLGLSELPRHIECFDNSNIQGTDPVASCVVFKDGVPSKRDYRHFNIKTVVGANDFASMKEVVNRRYSRLMTEGEPLPQLIVIDGGKGQLNFAYEALTELGLNDKIAIVGIAKRLEEIIVPGERIPLYLDKNSSSLRLLMALRDEAHRFGITHHRGKRSKRQIVSELDSIKGVGEVSREKLLRKFKTISKIKAASLEEISAEVGKKIGAIVYNYFRS